MRQRNAQAEPTQNQAGTLTSLHPETNYSSPVPPEGFADTNADGVSEPLTGHCHWFYLNGSALVLVPLESMSSRLRSGCSGISRNLGM